MDKEKHKIIKQHRVLPLAREFLEAIDFTQEPIIPWPEGVNRDELKRALDTTELVTFTLPIGQIDALSGNGFTYKESSVLGLVRQVNQKKPEGFWGHLREDEIGTKYSPAAVRWLAAELDDEGVAWGLGVALTETAGRHFKSAKALQARTGTSIFGWNVVVGEELDVYGYDLISIDLASSERVGIPITSAEPIVNTEIQGDEEVDKDKDVVIPDLKKKTKDGNESGADFLQDQVDTLRRQVSELRAYQTDLQVAKELLALGSDDDLATGIRQLQRERSTYASENQTLLANHITAELERVIKLESVRPLVLSLIMSKKPATTAEVAQAIVDITDSPEVKTLLEGQRETEGGPELGEDNNHEKKKGDAKHDMGKFMKDRPVVQNEGSK